jgi:hypothetical protein
VASAWALAACVISLRIWSDGDELSFKLELDLELGLELELEFQLSW